MSTLYLGHCDKGKIPNDKKSFLQLYHNVDGFLQSVESFKEDDRGKWRRFKEVAGQDVSHLQQFLKNAGFMPNAAISGIFGYATQAAVRLFQEYLRTVEGHTDIIPDGYAGSKTQAHIDKWISVNRTCHWDDGIESPDYQKWINVLQQGKDYYTTHKPALFRQIDAYPTASDTIKIQNWTFDKQEVHLIGIRLHENIPVAIRDNDDLYVLLIRGKVFYFYGSTDPNPEKVKRTDEPYLVEGQHKYRFAWHRISSEEKIYRAGRPYRHGVLVVRDQNDDDRYDESDIEAGIDPTPNTTINIHWTGLSNWSAGCQVISGKAYLDDKGNVISCKSFAADGTSDLLNHNKKTKGAYNLLTDLALCYVRPHTDYLYYTLGRGASMDLSGQFEHNYAEDLIAKMKNA